MNLAPKSKKPDTKTKPVIDMIDKLSIPNELEKSIYKLLPEFSLFLHPLKIEKDIDSKV